MEHQCMNPGQLVASPALPVLFAAVSSNVWSLGLLLGFIYSCVRLVSSSYLSLGKSQQLGLCVWGCFGFVFWFGGHILQQALGGFLLAVCLGDPYEMHGMEPGSPPCCWLAFPCSRGCMGAGAIMEALGSQLGLGLLRIARGVRPQRRP